MSRDLLTTQFYCYFCLLQGASNIMGSFFSCMPITASLSRSLVQETVGGKTQLTGLISCIILLFVMLWIGPFFEPLPRVNEAMLDMKTYLKEQFSSRSMTAGLISTCLKAEVNNRPASLGMLSMASIGVLEIIYI